MSLKLNFGILCLLLPGAQAWSLSLCDQKISSIVCLVNSPAHEADRYKDGRTCLPGSKSYANNILKAYHAYPPFVQKAVCDLRRIYIEKSFFGPAWSALESEADIHSGLIGLRRAELDANLALERYQSWFEEQSFGAPNDFSLKPGLPKVLVHSGATLSPKGVVYTLLHEMGHIFDYQRKFNDENCGEGCSPKTDSWMAISWLSMQAPKPIADFGLRKAICLNNCRGQHIKSSDAKDLYDGIYLHGFISQLASINAMEDFAESFATYVASEDMDIHFEIRIPSKKKYRLDDILGSPEFKPKLDFLRAHFTEH